MAGRPWVGAILIVKNERWETEKWRNVRTEWRQRAQDLDQGEESFKWNWKHMKSVFLWCPNAHRLATSYKGTIRVRQAEREREGDSETTWEETKTTSLILPLQFSITKIVVTCEFDPQVSAFRRVYHPRNFCFNIETRKKERKKEEGITVCLEAILHKRRPVEKPLFFRPHFHMLMHECKRCRRKRTVRSFHGNSVQSRGAKWSRSDIQVTRENSPSSTENPRSRIQSYDMFTVLKYAIKYSV